MLSLGVLLSPTKSSISMLPQVTTRRKKTEIDPYSCRPLTGNGGTAMGDKVTNVEIGVSDFAKLTEFATQHNVIRQRYRET